MAQDHWTELEKLIQTQLELQVKLSLGRHHAFMMKHGLPQCRHVADIGTGNGLFISRIAQMHPDIRFTGVDDKPHMIREAGHTAMTNISLLQADALDGKVIDLLAGCDGILMRYFILHLKDTASALPRLLEKVRPGTKLWIFDLDLGFGLCEPPSEAFGLFTGLVREFCDRNGVEIRTGEMLPPILEKAGFRTTEVAAEPFTNREVGPAVFADYMMREAVLYHRFLEGSYGEEKLHKMERFFRGPAHNDDHFVRYGMAMICAEKGGTRDA